MDLAQLKFVVDTTDLKNAAAEIDKLSTAVNKLNKPMQDAAKASQQLNKEQSNSEKSAVKTTESVKKQNTVLERQQAILEFMTEGYSKGQASQLAYAKAAGALSSDLELLGKVLQTQRKLMGTDPFDKSIGALQALRNEYTVTKEVQRLYNADLGLTKSQMEDLAKEKLRLIEKYKLENASLSDIKQGLVDLKNAYIQNASAENNITSAMKSKQKAASDVSKANQYIIAELDRVNRLTQENGTITSATNNALIRFEKALKMSGMSADEQSAKLQGYKKSLTDIQKQAGNRQVDYLSRALGPQITDIFVGLATGQSPMMVLLQQGGQLRDQFALAGVAGKDMGKMLTEAAKSMVTSIKDVAVAVGGLLINAFTAAGTAVTNAFLAPFKVFGSAVTGLINGTLSMSDAVAGLAMSFKGLAVSGIFVVVTALAALAMEYVKITSANTELSKAIALTGAGFGMTVDQARVFAENMASAGGNTLKFMGILTQFAKVGQQPSETLVRLASDLEKFAGQSADKTAEAYAKMAESPTKSLVELAKQQGFVTEKTLAQVYAAEKVGNKTEAARIAQEAYIASNQKAVAMIKSNLDPLQKLWIDIKDGISNATNAIYEFASSKTVVAIFRTAWETIAVIVSEVWYVIKETVKTFGVFTSQVAAILKGEWHLAASLGDARTEEANKSREAQDKLIKSILDRGEATQSTGAIERKVNSDNASTFDARMKSYEDYLKLLKQANDNYISLAMTQQHLTKSEAELAKVRDSQDWKKLTEIQKAQIESLYQAAAAIEHLKMAEEGRKKSLEFIANLTGQADKMGSAYYEGLQKLNEAQLELGLSEEQYNALANQLYKLTGSYKAFVDFKLQADKSIADSKALTESIMSQYTTDAMIPNEKAKAEAQIKFAKEAALAKAELDKDFAQSTKTMQGKELEDAKKLAQDKYDAKVKAAEAGKDRELYILSEGYQRFKAFDSAFQNLFTGMADAIVEFAKTGKLNFNDLINSMIADIARFELRQASLSIYQNLGIGDSLKSFFAPSVAQADGGAWMNGVQAFANGGAFTNSIVSQPTLFKFAKGTGLMGEAGPEAIMPLTRDSSGRLGVQSSGSSSNVSVQVINNTSAQATTNETTDSKGNRKIEVVIGDMTAGEISRSGSSSQKSIRSTFGITPQLIRR